MGQSWSRLQQEKNAKDLLELAPRKTPGQSAPLASLNAAALNAALGAVAAYIAKKNQQVTVIAIGGAVNTIFLRSREATQDVDFFNNDLTTEDYGLLIAGAKAACKAIKSPKLEEDWFNNHTLFFIPQDQRKTLTAESFAQNEPIFTKPGLTVLAAPWYYAFCCKIDRLAGGGIARPYDLDDAVVYMKRHMVSHGVNSVTVATIHAWFGQFQLKWNVDVETVLSKVKATGINIE